MDNIGILLQGDKMNSINSDKYNLFEKEVMKYFSFLEHEYDFGSAQIKKTDFLSIISYESPKVFVNLIYGPPEYEVTISFGRIGFDDKPGAFCFGQGDLVALDTCRDWKWNTDYPNRITEQVAEYARLLRECGSDCLKCDHSVFCQMKERRDIAVTIWHQTELSNRLRNEIDLAWHRKDYVTVISMYEKTREMLTEIDKKRFDYAKKHCQKMGQ